VRLLVLARLFLASRSLVIGSDSGDVEASGGDTKDDGTSSGDGDDGVMVKDDDTCGGDANKTQVFPVLTVVMGESENDLV
jgi:hypothetical protein